MPTFEDVEQFFLNFEKEMREEGINIMNDYNSPWLGLKTIDEKRDFEVQQQEFSEDEYYDEEIKDRKKEQGN